MSSLASRAQTGRDDLTVEQYLDLSVKAAPTLISNFQVVSRTVRTVGDEEQGVLEYTGTTSGSEPVLVRLHTA